MMPGTELAFAEDVKYDNRWIWTRAVNFRVGKFGTIDPHLPHRHHDAIEFPDGSYVLVTQLCEGQRVTVHCPGQACAASTGSDATCAIGGGGDLRGVKSACRFPAG